VKVKTERNGYLEPPLRQKLLLAFVATWSAAPWSLAEWLLPFSDLEPTKPLRPPQEKNAEILPSYMNRRIQTPIAKLL
jgi:hypothetical protein